MSGTSAGGAKVRDKMLARDPDYYKKLALLGQKAWVKNGKVPRGGFSNRELASRAGRIGGRKSKRGKNVK